MAHEVTRIRRDVKRRMLEVARIEWLTPAMRRIHFRSEDLTDFESSAADDHIKLFIPVDAPDAAQMRDYTPRAFDPENGTLIIDFAMHEAGPATRWAEAARVGDKLQIGGPRGSMVIADDFDWYLLVGDESAIPAIGRRLEELRPAVPVRAVLLVDSVAEQQSFDTPATLAATWIVRDQPRPLGDAKLLIDALRAAAFPTGEGYVWIAAEGSVARAVRAFVIDELGHPKAWTKAAGYWVDGGEGSAAALDD